MATKTKAMLFAIAVLFASSRVFASIPRSMMLESPAIDRVSINNRQLADDRTSIDNALLLDRAIARALPASAPIESLSETRVWGSFVDVKLTHHVEHPLTHALR